MYKFCQEIFKIVMVFAIVWNSIHTIVDPNITLRHIGILCGLTALFTVFNSIKLEDLDFLTLQKWHINDLKIYNTILNEIKKLSK